MHRERKNKVSWHLQILESSLFLKAIPCRRSSNLLLRIRTLVPVPLLPFTLTVRHLLLPRLLTLHLLPLFPLSVPLPGLQHQHPDQHERQDRVAGRHHLQTVIPPQKLLRPGLHALDTNGQLPLDQFAVVHPAGDDPHALDDVGEVDDDAAHVEHKAGAVEEHVGLGGPVELDEEAEQARADDGVQDARDHGR